MEEAPDPGTLMGYVMLTIYYLLIMFYWLGSHDDTETDEQAARPERAKTLGETFSAHPAQAALGLHAGLGIHPPMPVETPASGFDQGDSEAFLTGARRAYETIIGAFAAGDLEMIEPLVAPDVLDGFGAAVRDRDRRGARASVEIVAIKTAEIKRVDTDAEQVEVTVRFVSEQVTAILDADGKVEVGDPGTVVEVADFWRFAHRQASDDPNWVLVATDSEELAAHDGLNAESARFACRG